MARPRELEHKKSLSPQSRKKVSPEIYVPQCSKTVLDDLNIVLIEIAVNQYAAAPSYTNYDLLIMAIEKTDSAISALNSALFKKSLYRLAIPNEVNEIYEVTQFLNAIKKLIDYNHHTIPKIVIESLKKFAHPPAVSPAKSDDYEAIPEVQPVFVYNPDEEKGCCGVFSRLFKPAKVAHLKFDKNDSSRKKSIEIDNFVNRYDDNSETPYHRL